MIRDALAALLLGAVIAGSAAWVWQDNAYRTLLADQAADYGKQLADKDRVHAREREEAAAAALDQMAVQQAARRDLEVRLQAQDQAHWKEMNDAQQAQARLRDRLATADLRLSVLLDAGSVAAQGCDGGLRQAPGAGGVVHGTVRAELDRAHAQRIIAITNEGDDGLIALSACQAYILEIAE